MFWIFNHSQLITIGAHELQIFAICLLESVETESTVEDGAVIAIVVGLVEVEFIEAEVTEIKFLGILYYTRYLLICKYVVTELDHLMTLRALTISQLYLVLGVYLQNSFF